LPIAFGRERVAVIFLPPLPKKRHKTKTIVCKNRKMRKEKK